MPQVMSWSHALDLSLSFSKSSPPLHGSPNRRYYLTNPCLLFSRTPNRRRIYAENKKDGANGPAPAGFNLRRILDPDPDNIVAVGLTGLLAWASVQVLWQLFVISAAILFAALKYSIVAALLVFILVTLL